MLSSHSSFDAMDSFIRLILEKERRKAHWRFNRTEGILIMPRVMFPEGKEIVIAGPQASGHILCGN